MTDRRRVIGETSVGDVALQLVHQADQLFGETDPRQPFVALMAAAAIAGHIISREPGEMHKVLDQVIPLGKQLLEMVEDAKP